MWGRFVYREIVPNERLVYINSFSDPEGGIGRHPLAPDWPLRSFLPYLCREGRQDHRHNSVDTSQATEKERETFEKGKDSMQAGWSGTLDQLDTYLNRA